jgi:hypothetical protein
MHKLQHIIPEIRKSNATWLFQNFINSSIAEPKDTEEDEIMNKVHTTLDLKDGQWLEKGYE